MKTTILLSACVTLLAATPASAEILAMLNYESKPGETKKREGIALIDVDPQSPNFGKVVRDISLPAGSVNHHIFYNRDSSKAYVTNLGKGALYVVDMKDGSPAAGFKTVEVPDCEVGEDIVFSENNERWYLTCLGSNNVVVGDARADRPIKTIAADEEGRFIRNPHGIAIHEGIDRMLVTETEDPEGKHKGETIAEVELSTGKVLAAHKVGEKPGTAPVEVVFVPHSDPPVAYITNLHGGTLWKATWRPEAKEFAFDKAYDFSAEGDGVPLEIYFNDDNSRMFVTTALPGKLHVFDISQDVGQPKLIHTVEAAGGAHHVAFTRDGRYAFVQNNLIGLPKMDDGSITVVDLQKMEQVASIDTLKEEDLLPNSIVLLPEWNAPHGH